MRLASCMLNSVSPAFKRYSRHDVAGLYSINLIVAGDMSNIPLFTYDDFPTGRCWQFRRRITGHLDREAVADFHPAGSPFLFLKLLMDWFWIRNIAFLCVLQETIRS